MIGLINLIILSSLGVAILAVISGFHFLTNRKGLRNPFYNSSYSPFKYRNNSRYFSSRESDRQRSYYSQNRFYGQDGTAKQWNGVRFRSRDPYTRRKIAFGIMVMAIIAIAVSGLFDLINLLLLVFLLPIFISLYFSRKREAGDRDDNNRADDKGRYAL